MSDLQLSKFLSLVLRHAPEKIGIELDEHGWTNVLILIEKMNLAQKKIDVDILKNIVDTNPKKRFAFNETFDKIRASQGHSVDIELGYIAQQPPSILYHGTSSKTVDIILNEGIKKMTRQHVHLSFEKETALKVGARHGKPSILIIESLQMFHDQYEFFLSENGVWLTDHIPAKYIRLNQEND